MTGFQKAKTAFKDLIAGLWEGCAGTSVGGFVAAVLAFLLKLMIDAKRKCILVCGKLWGNRFFILKVVGIIVIIIVACLLFYRLLKMVAE